MENLDELINHLKNKTEELKLKLDELDLEILSDPNIPENIKNQIKIKREEENKPDFSDGLIITNKIVGYDLDTFEPIYEE